MARSSQTCNPESRAHTLPPARARARNRRREQPDVNEGVWVLGPGRVRAAIWTCAGRGGIGRARAPALGGGRPRGGHVGCGGVPEARRMWRQIDIRNARAATRPDGSKAAWIARKKAKGETASAQIAESTGVKAGRAQPCGPAPPPLASRHLIPAAHGQAVGRPAGALRARRGTGQPRSRRRAGAARTEGTLSAARNTHPAQDMHGSKADGVASEAKRWVRVGVGTVGNAAGPARCDQPGGRFTVAARPLGGPRAP